MAKFPFINLLHILYVIIPSYLYLLYISKTHPLVEIYVEIMKIISLHILTVVIISEDSSKAHV